MQTNRLILQMGERVAVRAEEQALAWISKFKLARNSREVLDLLGKAAAEFGFDACAIATLPDEGNKFEQFQYVRQWPAGWFEHYLSRGHYLHDPVIREAKRRYRPFRWSEAANLPENTDRALLVMQEAKQFGLNEGFCVPQMSLSGRNVNVTFGGRSVEMSRDEEGALQLIAIWAHIRARELLGDIPLVPKLSTRELDVLKYCASGLSTTQIADRLSISNHTVDDYFRRACRKLDVVTRVQAVAQATKSGLI